MQEDNDFTIQLGQLGRPPAPQRQPNPLRAGSYFQEDGSGDNEANLVEMIKKCITKLHTSGTSTLTVRQAQQYLADFFKSRPDAVQILLKLLVTTDDQRKQP